MAADAPDRVAGLQSPAPAQRVINNGMGFTAMTQSRLINHLWTLLAVTFGLICLTTFLWVVLAS